MPTNNHIITIRQINQVLLQDSYSYHSILMWAICYTASFGSLCCSDFTVYSQQTCDLATHILIEDSAIDSTITPSVIKLTIRQSETNPLCKGADLYLGKTEADLCPVLAILPYLVVRGPSPGALFILADGKPLTYHYLTTFLSAILSKDSTG